MASWIEQLGAFNPQFLRECRGRLKPNSLMATVGISLLVQYLLYISVMDSEFLSLPERYQQICRTLSWIMPYALFVFGGYGIVDDVAKEEKSGTLNFIRLSPRPAFEILLGKLLGVPLLTSLAVLLAVPCHCITGLLAGVSIGWLASYYLLLGTATLTVWSLALLLGLGLSSDATLGKKQQTFSAIGFASLALLFLVPLYMLWNNAVVWKLFEEASPFWGSYFGTQGSPLAEPKATVTLEWLYVPFKLLFAHLFTLANLGIATVLSWQVLLRKFRIPRSTFISKRLSYVMMAYLTVLGWGFAQSTLLSDSNRLSISFALMLLAVTFLYVLIFAITPSRQTLLDWLSYRRPGAMEWIWNDSAPAVGAIAINFAIAAGLLVPWVLLTDWQVDGYEATPFLLSVASVATNLLIYATIVQIILTKKLRSPLAWAIGVVAVLLFVPPTILGIFSGSAEQAQSPLLITLWTLMGLPVADPNFNGSFAAVAVGWAIQLVILSLLLGHLGKILKQFSKQRLENRLAAAKVK
jgi:hypothetical protein